MHVVKSDSPAHGVRAALKVAVGVLAAVVAVLGLSGVPAASAATARHQQSAPKPVGKAWPLPKQPARKSGLALLGNGVRGAGGASSAAITSASAHARATGKPVAVASLTTGTTTVTAEPNGTLEARDYVFPVRVRAGGGWVAVSTGLHEVAGGRLAPAAVPGDTVTFSDGGTAPMAEISRSGTSLALSWPGRLPVPVIAGSSATYRNVLPGVDLVLTATSMAAGGFSETLVVRTPAAARDAGLAGLALRVATTGTGRLRTVAGRGLTATMTRGRGAYVSPPAQMWDSSSVAPGAATVRSAEILARTAGAGLAAAGSGSRSSVAGPAGGARLAGVQARVGASGTALALAPDMRMLTSPSTKFPVYLDPSFTTITGTGGTQATDVVQSDCPSPHYDDSSYSAMPVGYDNFQAGSCQYESTDYALYQVAIPSGTFGSHSVLISATLQTQEVYTSSCSASASVTTSWIGGMNPSTAWPGPSLVGGNVNAADTVGPDSGSCNTVEDTANRVAAGFNLKPDLAKISSAAAITLRLWEPGNTNDADHKQFTKNPDLQVVYTETPNTPSGLKEASTNSGTNSLDCDTSPTNPPIIGKTDSAEGPWLLGTYSDPDGAAVQANIRYRNYTTSSAFTTVNKAIDNLTASNANAAWQMPASYTSGLHDGTVIEWQAQAETGSASVDGANWGPYSSAWTNPCYFSVYPQAPDPPSVTSSSTQASPGSSLTFTITQSSGDAANEFVWSVDQTPPTAASAQAFQTCSAATAEEDCTQITNGIATLTVPVTGPGPHDLFVYQVDPAGNESQPANPTFTGLGDPNVQFTSGDSLQANFFDSFGQVTSPSHTGLPYAYDNTMISGGSGGSGNANADGGGKSFDEAQLKAAGWNPGGTVTVDGATFTLPDFDPSASGGEAPWEINYTDNILAANQTIGTGPSGEQGSALVFLATSTDGNVTVPGTASGSPDSGVLSGDMTAPSVMGGVPTTGASCDGEPAFNSNVPCTPATGTINYASGCSVSQAPYTLTVPDWVTGPSNIAAIELPDWDTPTGQQAQNVKIYAFAVPLNSSCTVSSVTLPDVAASVNGVTTIQPALHIFGMSMRNTATATPEVNATAAAAPSGQAWTGTFESPIENAYEMPASSGNQTYRLLVSPGISAPAGAQVRIKLSDPGFLSEDGAGPLVIGAATIANRYYDATPAQTPASLTFGGSDSVTIPEGGDVFSDPLTLPFAVTPGTGLLVSFWIENSSLPVLPLNAWASGGLAWYSAPGTANETADTSGTPFTGSGGGSIGAVPVLTAVDVTTPAETSPTYGSSSPGAPTVVVAGDNVIDGFSSDAASDAINIPSQRVAGQLSGLLPSLTGTSADDGLTDYGVVDGGVQSNQVLADGTAEGGISLLARVDADILAEPDVGTVVLDEGLEDVLRQAGSASAVTNLTNAYTILVQQLSAFGINVITGDLTPCSGYSNSTVADSCSSTVDGARTDVNSFVDGGGGAPNCTAAFDAAVSNGASTEALASGYGEADDVNLTLGASGGYARLASAVVAPSTGCQLMPNIPAGS
jgi:hypothetical protein